MFKRILVVVALVLLAAPVSAAPKADLSWAHERSDLTPDASVRFGKLANGMRFALKRNGAPKDAVTVYLRIAAGSLHEADDQRGLAHFLEHLAFQGSTNVPRGEMMKTLQRLGARMGADANAFTSFEETVYQFELPRSDAVAIDSALMLMREIADRLTLTQEAMDSERGVVLSELKLTDQPASRNARQYFSALLPGSRHTTRWPIGERSVIEGAWVETVRKFYRQYYRPERALLIVVGEIDPGLIESKVTGLFSDWKQPGPAGANPKIRPYTPGPLRADSFSDPSLPESVSINRLQPEDLSPPTKARYLRAVKEGVVLSLMNQRLLVRSRQDAAGFEAAGVAIGEVNGVAQYFRLVGTAKPGRWKDALRGIDHELRGFSTFGTNPVELNREVHRIRAESDVARSGAASLTNSFFANMLLSSVRNDFVFLTTDQHIALREEALQGLTVPEVNAIAGSLMGSEPALVFVTSPQPVAGGSAEIAAAYRDSLKQKVDAPPVVEARPFPYTNFGPAGRVGAKSDVADFGAAEIMFDNGMRLNVKSTDFRQDRIIVALRFAGGALDFPRDKPVLRGGYGEALVLGGLKQMDYNDLVDSAAERTYGTEFGVGDDGYVFFGATNKKDLLFQLQVLAAYSTDAGYDPKALDVVKTEYQAFWQQRRATPRGALGVELGAILRSKDARWVAPPLETVNGMKMEEIEAALDPVLHNRPLDIAIVGDVTADAAIDAVAQTFGALPKRSRTYAAPAGAREVRFPGRQQLTLSHDGRADQAIAHVSWPGPDYHANPRQARAFRLMRDVFLSELMERLRGQGKAYTPEATSFMSKVFPGFGYLAVTAETSPSDLDFVYREVDAIATAMREGAITEDMLVRARTPLLGTLENGRRMNEYWVAALLDYYGDPRALAEERSIAGDYQTITKDEIVEVARKYLDDTRRVEVRVLPANGAVASLMLPKDFALSSDWTSTFETLSQTTMGGGEAVPLKLDTDIMDRAMSLTCWDDRLPC